MESTGLMTLYPVMSQTQPMGDQVQNPLPNLEPYPKYTKTCNLISSQQTHEATMVDSGSGINKSVQLDGTYSDTRPKHFFDVKDFLLDPDYFKRIKTQDEENFNWTTY